MELKSVLVGFFGFNERDKKILQQWWFLFCVPRGKGDRWDFWETMRGHWPCVFQAAASRWYSWNYPIRQQLRLWCI